MHTPTIKKTSRIEHTGSAPRLRAAIAASAVAMLASAASGQCDPSALFGAFSTDPLVNTPNDLAVGDLNGDGREDVAAISQNGRLAIAFGQADGSLLFDALYIPTGSLVIGLTLGDVDNDNDLDVIYASRLSPDNVVVVGLNDGAGTLSGFAQFASGAGVGDVEAADMDGDGNLDLVAVNIDDDTVSVLLGNGDGTFGPPAATAVGNVPRSVDLADIDLDGDVDAVVANITDNTVSVLLNTGDGTLVPQPVLPVPGGPIKIKLSTQTADAFPEIVVICSTTSQLRVYQNQSGSSPGAFTLLNTFSTVADPGELEARDVTGDGRDEFVVTSTLSTDAQVFSGSGTPLQTFTYGIGSGAVAAGFADLNDDGAFELVVGQFSTGNSAVLPGLCSARPTITQQPECAVVNEGGPSQTFTVNATNALTVQWRLNGVDLVNGPLASGVNAPTLTLAAELANIGGVDAVLTNAAGPVSTVTVAYAVIPGSVTCPTDTNNDDVTDLADLLAVLAEFGNTCP